MLRCLEGNIYFDARNPQRIFWYDVDAHIKDNKIHPGGWEGVVEYGYGEPRYTAPRGMGYFMVPCGEAEIWDKSLREKIITLLEREDDERRKQLASDTAVDGGTSGVSEAQFCQGSY